MPEKNLFQSLQGYLYYFRRVLDTGMALGIHWEGSQPWFKDDCGGPPIKQVEGSWHYMLRAIGTTRRLLVLHVEGHRHYISRASGTI